ncbi:MAG: master DNA invertase Mpi family serine-type recombinase [Paludibacteraceae bacterium]|nr:master DNA invertase Mpi family serine-type recombinase [Paludibacteraceae bacterium]
MVYGYIRVSSDKQTVENQRYEIENFCRKNDLTVDSWIEEMISGTKDYRQRRLGHLLRLIKSNDLIICTELSRLGRNFYMIMEILSLCMNKGCRVWTIKDGYRLGNDIQSKVLAFAFGISAEIERTLISQRTKEALARRKAEGKHLGRRKGAVAELHQLKLHKHHKQIVVYMQQGDSAYKISRKLKCGYSQVRRYIERYTIDQLQKQ